MTVYSVCLVMSSTSGIRLTLRSLGDDGRAVKITYLKDFKSTGVRKLAITKNQNQPLFATPEQPLAVRHAKGSKDRGGNRTKMPLEAPTTLAAAFKQYDDEYGSQAFETKAAKGSKVTYMIVAEDLDTLKELALRHMALLPKDVDSETMIVNTLLGL